MRKQKMKEAFEAGQQGYGRFNCAPASNLEFMKTVPNCSFGDIKGVKLRAAMYKEYIRGWTFANLESE